MSERNFVRRFVETVGITPGRYVRQIRLEAARRKLEEGDQQVARSRRPAASARKRRFAARSSRSWVCHHARTASDTEGAQRSARIS